ncbi:MAG: amidohydrolase family protein, partial [Candidatus Bathyarchaeia archaeon]
MNTDDQLKAVIGGTLIDGTGAPPLRDATVLVEGGVISDVGKGVDVPEEAEVFDASGMVVMPGLIDAHVHLCGNGDPSIFSMLQYQLGLIQLMAARNALDTLEAGFTTVRDMGAPMGFAVSLRRAIEMGISRGPRIVACGRVISQTGGHADFHLPIGISFGEMSRIADGPEEVRKAAREQLRDGADWVKICSSGGVMSPTDPVDTRQFTVDEIRAAVEEAAAVGKSVASHAHGTTGIRNAVVAGVRTIEHGSIMDEEVVGLMAERGVLHVPTLVASWHIVEHGREGGIPEYAVAKAEQIAEYPARSMMLSHRGGVKVAMGTDSGSPFNRHGENSKELELMVEAG